MAKKTTKAAAQTVEETKENVEADFQEIREHLVEPEETDNPEKVEHYAIDCCEQMIETSKELEDQKAEYRVVTSYLNDIEVLENLPEEEKLRAMTMKNICMGMVDSNERGITFNDDDGMLGIIFFQEEEGDMVLEEMEEIVDIIKDEFDMKPKVVVGSTVQGFGNLQISYNDARYLMENEKESIRDIVQNLGAESRVPP